MKIDYVCRECGTKETVDDPMGATKPCDCGGTMRAQACRPVRPLRVRPETSQEETSLMGAAWRGEL